MQLMVPNTVGFAVIAWLFVVGYALFEQAFGLPIFFGMVVLVRSSINHVLLSNSDYCLTVSKLFGISFYVAVCVSVMVSFNYELINGYPIRSNDAHRYDDWKFYEYGLQIATKILALDFNLTEELSVFSHNGYPLMLGVIYSTGKLVGADSPMVARLFNCLGGALLVPVVASIAYRSFDKRVALLSAKLVAYFPLFWFYSANIVRDIWVALCVCLIVSQFLELSSAEKNVEKRNAFLKLCITCAILYFLRNDSFYVILIAIILAKILFPIFDGDRRQVLAIMGILAVVLFLTTMLGVGQPIEQILGKSSHYDGLIEAGASTDSLGMKLIFSQPAPIKIPLQFMFTLFGPAIKTEYFIDALEIAGAIWWTMISPCLVVGVWKLRESVHVRYHGTIIFILILAISMIVGNPRHKLQFYALATIIISLQITYLPRISWFLFGIWLAILCALIFLYGVIKYT